MSETLKKEDSKDTSISDTMSGVDTSMSTGMTDMLDDLEDTIFDKETEKAREVEKLKLTAESDEREKRMLKSFDLRMRGMPVESIAKALSVSERTIRRDLEEYADRFKQDLERRPAASLIGESLAFISNIRDTLLYEYHTMDVDEKSIDPLTGLIKTTGKKKNNRLPIMQAAMEAERMRLDLMMKTGVLPKAAEKLYHTIKQESVDKDKNVEDRSEDEIRQSIVALTKRGRKLIADGPTSSTPVSSESPSS